MKVIGVRELRQYASRYIAEVAAGEEITVTNRGRTVARIVPVSDVEQVRADMIKAGTVIPARAAGGITEIRLEELPRADMSAVLEEERADR